MAIDQRPPSIGQPVARVDGRAKVTGAARYAAEFNQPDQAYAALVSATIGLGRIVEIDTSAAERMPGVLAVITHRNAPRLAYRPHKAPIDPAFGERLHVFQDDEVRFYGQPIAVVVARTLEEADRATGTVGVRYDVHAATVRADRASHIVPQAGLQPVTRIAADTSRGNPEEVLASSAVRVDATYTIPRENHSPIEPHATVAAWNGERLTLWSKSQFVVNEAAEIAAVFGMEREQVTVICPYIGGAFGTSLRTWPHVTIAALAARQVARPVKLVLTRRQMFYATGHRPHSSQRVALGADRNGKLTSLIHEGVTDTSRYEEFAEALVSMSNHMYSCTNVRTRYRLAPLDISTPNHMRGPGEASGIFALETAMDELSVALGMDPIELRLRNEPSVDEGNGRPFSSRSLRQCFAIGAERFGWSRRIAAPRSMRDGRLLLGWGVAAAAYPVLQGPASARVRLFADGTVEVEAAASDMGPGTYTSMTQVAADALGIAAQQVRFSLGRSDFPPAPPHGGSQTMASVGTAIHAAAQGALLRVENLVAETAGGTIRNEVADFGALLARAGVDSIESTASSARSAEAQNYSMHAFGALFVEVTVDPDLGLVRVRRVVGAYGAGRIVNPRLANSQCIGGMIGGIGMALMEQTVVDPRDGRPVNAHMADYLVPVNLDIGALEAIFVDEVDPHVNALGVKGLGEIALVGMAPAIGNAVYHATGKRVRDLPIRNESLVPPAPPFPAVAKLR